MENWPEMSQPPTATPTRRPFWKAAVLLIILALIVWQGISMARRYLSERERDREDNVFLEKLPETTITIREGWRASEIGEYLEKNGIVSKKDFLAEVKDFPTGDYKFLTQGAGLEGFLFPDTYRIYDYGQLPEKKSAQEISRAIIKKMLDNFETKVYEKLPPRPYPQNLSLQQVITLASIIEKETGRNAVTAEQQAALNQERLTVAGIFYNRLEAGVALQSDATVNFATGKNLPSPTSDDLSVKSPYNTYLHKGLPPGPIGNPSFSSINAAVHPKATDYFYFLHKQPSGEPVYSRTFEEHIANKNKYLK